MSKYAKLALFVALGLALVLSPHASHAYYAPAQTANKYSATIAASKASYGAGESITLSGTVKPYDSSRQLQIIVRDSANNIAALETASVNADGTYSYSLSDTAKWKKDTYKVSAQYGYDDVDIGTATFSFDPAVKAQAAVPAISAPAAKSETDTKAPVKKTVEKKQVKKTEPKKPAKKTESKKAEPKKTVKKTAKPKTIKKSGY